MSKPKASPDPSHHTQPQDAGSDDALYAQYVRDKIEAGLDSLNHAGGVPHDQARRRMAKWLDD